MNEQDGKIAIGLWVIYLVGWIVFGALLSQAVPNGLLAFLIGSVTLCLANLRGHIVYHKIKAQTMVLAESTEAMIKVAQFEIGRRDDEIRRLSGVGTIIEG